ncbi:MAG: alpha-glucosidase/alpha-galactosidase [Bacteroidetes bacterium]|nr:alpha-glucosidase/alpha-galactosidase [Bacteroidota bacterium]
MAKITFMGAGSTIFVKNILGDSMLSPALHDAHLALYDIDGTRLNESMKMLETINENINSGRATITGHLGEENRRAALTGADYVINAIQVGGYEPSTVIDFEIPKKYGLQQTIADTLGIGGIFRALRTIPVVLDFAGDMDEVCPDALFINYGNPMAMITGALQQASNIKSVGLCHSVQSCAERLLQRLDIPFDTGSLNWKIAGINHQAWLLSVSDSNGNLYPDIREKAEKLNAAARMKGAEKHHDMVRLEIMKHFDYYVTESSEHNAEYMPYWIKHRYPELIEEFNIPLDEYPRRCIQQIKDWKEMSKTMIGNSELTHTRTSEYGSYIMEAIETGIPYRIHGNIQNRGLISNLPSQACVEIPCLVDRNGVQGCYVGALPEQLAALNMTNINVQTLVLDAALNHRRSSIYHAAMLDPHTAAELSLDDIRAMCDELIEAHGNYLPEYR